MKTYLFLYMTLVVTIQGKTTLKENSEQPVSGDCLAFSERSSIYKYCVGNGSREILLNEKGLNIVALDVDTKTDCVYYISTSSVNSSINVICLRERITTRLIRPSNFTLLEGFALDWVTDNIYWLERATHRLGVTSNDGKYTKVLYEGVEIFDKPRSLVLHPGLGLLFWTDWSDTNPRVARGSMNGDPASLRTLVEGTEHLGWVNGIALDFTENRLYWADAKLDRISSVHIDGNDLRVVVNVAYNQSQSHPFGITLTSDSMYWTDWMINGIASVRRDNSSIITTTLTISPHPMGISMWLPKPAVSRIPQPAECPHLQLLGFRSPPQCHCADGFIVSYRDSKELCIPAAQNSTIIITAQTECKEDHFSCGKNRCIPEKWLCDGQADCPGGTDEEDCGNMTCSPTEMDCGDGRCIPQQWRCDGDTDCVNKRDEKNCSIGSKTCLSDYFDCGGGKCIPQQWRCDGVADCTNKLDEESCHNSNKTCPPKHFDCGNGKCIPQGRRCDGAVDCANKLDEEGCPKTSNCSSDEFRCNSSSKCIKSVWRCDGRKDCAGGEDELACQATTAPPPLFDDCLVYTSGSQIRRICPYNYTNQLLDETESIHITADVDVDYSHRCMFYAVLIGSSSYSIKELCPNRSWMKVGTFADERPGSVEGIAYDWSAQNLYWLDHVNRELVVSDRAGRYSAVLYGGEGFGDARDLVLHPTFGVLFWSDWSYSPAIMRASMAGDNSTVRAIVKGTATLEWPNGIALDTETEHLYWVDAKKDQIMRCDLNGQGLVKVRSLPSFSHPYGIVVSSKFLYWSDWTKEVIFATSKTIKDEKIHTIKTDLRSPKGMALVPRYAKVPIPCPWSCPHLCLVGYDEGLNVTFRTCRCSDGFRLARGNGTHMTCVPLPTDPVNSTEPTVNSTTQRPNSVNSTEPTGNSTTQRPYPVNSTEPTVISTTPRPSFPFRELRIEGQRYTELTFTCRPLRLHRLCPLRCFIQVDVQDGRRCFKCVCR